MGTPATPLRHKLVSAVLAGLLACGLLPAIPAFAEEGAPAEAVLASSLDDGTGAVLNTDVELAVESDNAEGAAAPEPVVGSFTSDGLTYALGPSGATLVAVDPSVILSEAAVDAERSGASPFREGSGVEGSLTGESEDSSTSLRMTDSSIAVPSYVAYGNIAFEVTAVGPYAFYLSGAASIELPATILSVDSRAFRSSDVERVEVATDNLTYASFDGCLYDSHLLSLLLIPEGRKGSVLLSCETEVVEASKFSHCSLVDAISVEEGGAAFSSWEGLLYDASGNTLLRVPAGATEITIRDGCTTVAAGAMEGCVRLERINAPANIRFVSPNAFEEAPSTVSLPAGLLAGDDAAATKDVSDASDAKEPSQLTAMVALSDISDSTYLVDVSSIKVLLPPGADDGPWANRGLSTDLAEELPEAEVQSASTYAAEYYESVYTFVACYSLENQYVNGVAQSTYIPHTAPANGYASGRFAGTDVVVYNSPGSQYISLRRSDQYITIAYDYFGHTSTERGKYIDRTLYWYSNLTGVVTAGVYTQNVDVYLGWGYTAYTIAYNSNGGSACSSASGNITQNVTLPTPTRMGYTFKGWKVGSSTYGAGAVSVNTLSAAAGCGANATSETITLTAQWEGNPYTVEYWDRTGTNKISTDTGWIYGTARNLLAVPETGLSTGYTPKGWSNNTNQTAANYAFGSSQSNLATSGTKKLYLAEAANSYTVTLDPNGGGTPTGQGTASVTYDSAKSWAIPEKNPSREGFAFTGWADSTGTLVWDAHRCVASDTSPYWKPTSNGEGTWRYTDDLTVYAQWEPVISADVPATATVIIDKVGVAEQTEASGYIKSLCGEPLKVDMAACTSQAGAQQQFGGWAGQTELLVATSPAGSPDLAFPLGADGFTVEDGSPSTMPQFVMASYGTSLPLYYRFAIPDGFPLIDLTEGTSAICQVNYTVALA